MTITQFASLHVMRLCHMQMFCMQLLFATQRLSLKNLLSSQASE